MYSQYIYTGPVMPICPVVMLEGEKSMVEYNICMLCTHSIFPIPRPMLRIVVTSSSAL